MTASWQKVFSADPRVGYFTQAGVYRDAQDAGEVLPPAQDQGQMDQIIFNSTLNGILQSVFARAGAGRRRQRRRGDRAGDPGGRAARPRRSRPCRRSSSNRPGSSRRPRRSGRSPSTSGWSAPGTRRAAAAVTAAVVRAWRGRALVPAGVHRRGELGPLPGALRGARAHADEPAGVRAPPVRRGREEPDQPLLLRRGPASRARRSYLTRRP